jgi:hypothetical protein
MSKKLALEAEFSRRASELSLWKGLVEHPGWKLYEKTLKEQQDGRLLVLAEPCSGLGGMLAQEFMKGEAAGFRTARGFPEMQIEILQVDLRSLEVAVQLEEENELERKTRAADAGRVDNEWDWSS